MSETYLRDWLLLYTFNSKTENVKNILTLTKLDVLDHNNSCCDIHFKIVFHGFQVLILKNRRQFNFKTTLKNVCGRIGYPNETLGGFWDFMHWVYGKNIIRYFN